ncbi:MAG: large-conductance mechanosensitive channel protein MscL [Ignavibacteria bacterium]|nr:large-conductance mechanosensitive channel protein MscL [Ignavibacteria bacterium]MBP6510336.1 large-conductance mechanosensitive channel protein MscL [Candidatus Kapabacteria bacterium]MBK6419983.1 large-conductance mechanosensitive channel protein MscL [Ignavibacteria bacterium]MBK6759384.1 large-conductance mechanosensitive channel protein MscL [Ignavibacteria bacterium]MBK7185113.1 large-conductance mechanosensitive channel protein MscL [Ignavibacteria bacterium]
MISEFKEFISKGNVIDLAIGVIIGGAFGAITASLVNDIIMPPIGMILGGINFTDIATTLKAAGPDGKGAVMINWGKFFQVVLNFLIIAFVMFLVVKTVNAMKRKQEDAPAAPAEPSDEVKLLTEIRDSLRK